MKRLLLFVFIAISYSSYSQATFDENQLTPHVSYGQRYDRMKLDSGLALPVSGVNDTAKFRHPGLIRILNKNFLYCDLFGVWHSVSTSGGTATVSVTKINNIGINIGGQAVYYHTDNAPPVGNGAIDLYLPLVLPSTVVKTDITYNDPTWLTISQNKVTGLTTTLAGKAATTHTHAFSSLTGIPPALLNPFTQAQADTRYSPLTHTHTIANVSGLQTELNNKVSVVAGKQLSDRNYSVNDSLKLAGITGTGGNNYVLPVSTTTVLGGIKVGTGFTVDATGVANVSPNTTPVSAAWGTITGTLSAQADLSSALGAKVTANMPIVSATGSKVTWDTKGLITSTAPLTATDVAEVVNKRFVTDAQKALIGNQTNITGNAGTVTTNANLTGPVSSVGNATIIAAGAVTNTNLAGSITAAKLVGTDIATVGTITAGTWHGAAIADAYITTAATWNAKVPPTRKVNGKPLSADVVLTGADLALPNFYTDTVTTSTGVNPIFSPNDSVIAGRALMPTSTYNVVRDSDTTYHLDFGGNVRLGYSMQGQSNAVTLTSGDTLYVGSTNNALSATAGRNRLYVPKSGTITKVSVFYDVNTVGTALQNTLFTVESTPASTGVSVRSTIQNTTWATSSTVGRVSNNSMNIPVTEGDWFEVRVLCPVTTGTLPSGARLSFVAFIE